VSSAFVSANSGTRVENSVAGFALLSRAGYRIACSSVPRIAASCAVTVETFPACTCSRKVGE
jgi:hypothetical protein